MNRVDCCEANPPRGSTGTGRRTQTQAPGLRSSPQSRSPASGFQRRQACTALCTGWPLRLLAEGGAVTETGPDSANQVLLNERPSLHCASWLLLQILVSKSNPTLDGTDWRMCISLRSLLAFQTTVIYCYEQVGSIFLSVQKFVGTVAIRNIM